MRRASALVFLMLAAACGPQVPPAAQASDPVVSSPSSQGNWAASGRVAEATEDGSGRIASPDARLSLQNSANGWTLSGSSATALPGIRQSAEGLVEVVWSPDARSFAVNWSDGGLVGTWTTSVYSLDASGRPEARDVLGAALQAARDFPKCETPETPNMAIAGWLHGGEELLVIAEAPPHSACSNMGELTGFRISATSARLIEQIPQDTLLSSWREHLGPRVLAAGAP